MKTVSKMTRKLSGRSVLCLVATSLLLCGPGTLMAQQPATQTTQPITTLDGLSTWVSGTDPWNVSSVSLASRPAITYPGSQTWVQNAPDQSTTGLMFNMHDMGGGYQADQDLTPAGVSNGKLYTFTEWQYIDTFVYFTHKFVSIPPPGWTNSAHRNGVKCLSTVIIEGSNTDAAQEAQARQMLSDLVDNALSRSKYVQQLVSIAKYYKFDGYLINIEVTAQTPARAVNVEMFVTQLRAALKAANAGNQVVWYDSVNPSTGAIDYQNELNGVNMPFFTRSDGMVTNYFWGQADQTASPETSAKNAGTAKLNVFTGVDVWRRPENPQQETDQEYFYFDSYLGVREAMQAGTSLGLFAPAWTYEQALPDKSDFPERDAHFWTGTASSDANPSGGIAQYIVARAVPSSLPFVTDFNRGFGSETYNRGALVSSSTWGNVGSVDPLPTWRTATIAGSSASFSESFTGDWVFTGGSSFEFAATPAVQGEYALCPLFRTQFANVRNASYSLNASGLGGALVLVTSDSSVYVLPGAGTPNLPAVTTWGVSGVFPPTTVTPSSSTVNSCGWETRTYDLTTALSGKTVVSMGFLAFSSSSSSSQFLELGEIQLR